MVTIRKSISYEIIKWISYDMELFRINEQISDCYQNIILLDNDTKKHFNRLHFLKMKRHFIYLKIYHNNIKKISSNEKLLCYLESILLDNGFNISRS